MKSAQFKKFLALPEVKSVTRNENQALFDRRGNQPACCEVFEHPYSELKTNEGYTFEIDPEARRLLPRIIGNQVQDLIGADKLDAAGKKAYERARTIGIVFSGGPAPGGHNVIAGSYDAARKANPENRVIGFLMGPDGIIENQSLVLTDELVDSHRNLGGFGLIKTGRTKIDSQDKLSRSRETCLALGLDALVIIGGDDSNTNAAFLAQELAPAGIQVIGVPKTIDGDVQVRDTQGKLLCAMSFGFHSAARAFSQDISNLSNDGSSDVKYWHICKVMGRVASHLALEVTLQTHANIALIGEEIADYVDNDRVAAAQAAGVTDYTAYGMTLRHLSRYICDGIVRRAAAGKNYGLVVIPEGILEFINEIGVFITKLNNIIAEYNATHDRDFHSGFPRLDDKLEFLRRLARRDVKSRFGRIWNMRDDDLFNDLPDFFQQGLLTERDSHGNFQFSQV
ncbi:MAG: 6-phosphofructokinase, partial [Desulfobacterales bacterium]